jgi:hypothetical protein
MSDDFVEAVAKRANAQAEEVEVVLDHYAIIPKPNPPKAIPLRIAHITFSGIKTIDGDAEPFNFEWNTDEPGVWGLGSPKNQVGKTSVLQIALWALRGKPKRLNAPVIDWIDTVEVKFAIGNRRLNVSFKIIDDEPRGIAEFEKAGEPIKFDSSAGFRRVMQGIMLDALSLEPMATSQTGKDGKVSTRDDGWTAYTNAFLSDAHSNSILGEAHVDMAGRVLGIFLGLPYAETLYNARSQLAMLTSIGEQRAMKRPALGNRSLDDLDAELKSVVSQIDASLQADEAAKESRKARREFYDLQRRYFEIEQRRSELEAFINEAITERIRAQRAVISLSQEQAAKSLFKRLAPVQCPRCSHGIDDTRRENEAKGGMCSVCTEPLQEADEKRQSALLADAKRIAKTAKIKEDEAKAEKTKVRDDLSSIDVDRKKAALRFNETRLLGTAADADILELRCKELETLIGVGNRLASTENVGESALNILRAAVHEAEAMRKTASETLIKAASVEIVRIVKKLGMLDVESAKIDLAAHVTLRKGGSDVSFGDLSAGEQLRLRIATVIALVRSANVLGVGRHPGLLIIDAPANQEMSENNLAEELKELVSLTEEVGAQMFIVTQRVEALRRAIPAERLRIGESLW